MDAELDRDDCEEQLIALKGKDKTPELDIKIEELELDLDDINNEIQDHQALLKMLQKQLDDLDDELEDLLK
jgi:septal ring factor EnvC (AmiA/AmiB activator)